MKRTYKKRTQVNIEMTEEQRNHLKAKAIRYGISMTALIKRALDNYSPQTDRVCPPLDATGYCRPCGTVRVAVDDKCTVCGEWTIAGA